MSYLSTSPGDPNNLGYFATPAALIAAYPVGVVGAYAIVGSTDTFWVWDDGTSAWVNSGASASGDVTGPASSVANSIVRFNGATGKIIQGYTSGAPTISDTGDITLGGNKSIIGGTAVGSNITYKSTTGAGTAAGIAHQFIGGTDGATIAATILNNGRVGIGATAPTAALQIGTASSTGNHVLVLGSGTEDTYLVFSGQRKYPRFELVDTFAGGSTFNMWNLGNQMRFGTDTGAAGNAAWYTKAGVAADVIFNGRVGIGTANPTNILSLGNAAARKFWIEDSATDVVGRALTVSAGGTLAGTSVSDVVGGNLILQSGLGTGTGESTISFQTGTTLTTGTTLQTMSTKMTILGSGNVGIGTTSPSQRLSVDGNIALRHADWIGTSNAANNPYITFRTDNSGMIESRGAFFDVYNSNFRLINARLEMGNGFDHYNGISSSFIASAADAGNPIRSSGKLIFRNRYWNGAASTDYEASFEHIQESVAPESRLAWSIGGSERFSIKSTGNVGIGTTTPDRLLHEEVSDAVTNVVTYSQRHTHITSGTAAIGFGVGEEYELENASGTNRVASTLETTWSDPVDATEDATWRLRLMRAGTLTDALTVDSLGTLTTAANIELGHATDTTLSRSAAGVLAVEGVVIPTISSTSTLTNKTITSYIDTGKRIVTLTDAATIATDAALGNILRVTLTANRTLGVPTNPTDGQMVEYQFKQDATGSRTITFTLTAGGFRGSTDTPLPTLTTTANATDRVLFEYRLTPNFWEVVAVNKGYAS